jgi:hypothetical protein
MIHHVTHSPTEIKPLLSYERASKNTLSRGVSQQSIYAKYVQDCSLKRTTFQLSYNGIQKVNVQKSTQIRQ